MGDVANGRNSWQGGLWDGKRGYKVKCYASLMMILTAYTLHLDY
jgi:hypothetical protein